MTHNPYDGTNEPDDFDDWPREPVESSEPGEPLSESPEHGPSHILTYANDPSRDRQYDADGLEF